MTFARRWETAVRTNGDRPFLIFEGPDRSVSQWTYRQFDEVVTRMGATLAAAGVTAGSSVHVVLRNCPAFIAIWLACARSGAWLVPVDPTSTARDIGRQLDRVRPAAGFCAASRADVYAAGVQESAAGQLTVIELTETAADVAPARGRGRKHARTRPEAGGRGRRADGPAGGHVHLRDHLRAEGRRAHPAQLRARGRHDVRRRRAAAGAPLAGDAAVVPRQRAVLLHRARDRGRRQRRPDLGFLRVPVAAAGQRPGRDARQPVRRADPDDPRPPAGRRAGRAASSTSGSRRTSARSTTRSSRRWPAAARGSSTG